MEGGTPVSSQQQLQEQEKRIELSCALAAEASRRSRLLSGEESLHMAANDTFSTTLLLTACCDHIAQDKPQTISYTFLLS